MLIKSKKTSFCRLFLSAVLVSVESVSAEGIAKAGTAKVQELMPSRGDQVAELMVLTVPVMQSGVFIGEIGIKVAIDGSGLLVNASHLASLYNAKLSSDAMQQLKVLPEGKFVGVAEAKALGLDLSFNMAMAAVQASIVGSARAKTDLTLSGGSSARIPNVGREPRGVSGFLNMYTSTSASDFNDGYEFSDLAYSFDGALHVASLWNMTLEAFGSVDGEGDLKRGDIRAIWRSTNRSNDWQLRLGDVGISGSSYMGGARIQGMEFTNTDSRRRDRASVASIGNREFFLERSGVARLLIDGRETKRFDLEPGPYNVKDFPLTNGANNIEFIIEDDRGEVERIEFNEFSDTSLVAKGEYSYSFSLGHGLSNAGNYQYDSSKAVASGFFETGITPALSLGVGLQLTEKAQLGVTTAKLGTPIGRFDFDAGFVFPEKGESGKAAKLTWRNQRINKNGRHPSLAISAAYQSKFFSDLFGNDTFNEEAWRLSAGYSKSLQNGYSLGLSSNYTQNRTISDSQKHTFRLGKSYNKWSLGSSVSYRDGDNETGWEGGLIAGYNFGKSARLTGNFNYDLNGQSSTELNISSGYSKGLRLGRGLLDYNIGLSADKNGDGSVNGGLNYRANRFEFSVSHSTSLDSLADGSLEGQRTTFRAGAAVAFANGKFAIGRPIRDSFAIFYPHDSILDKNLLVGRRDKQGLYRVQSDGFGPLIAELGSSYQETSLQYDVIDLPLGYDLGTGLTSLAPRYKSGFAVQVGSAYNVIATATLLDLNNRTLKLLLGKATELGVKTPRTSDAFTDNSGRLSASGLSAGRWKVEMFAKKPVTYILNVPKGKTGIVELGKLKPTPQK